MAIRAVVSGAMPGGERWANVFHFRGDTVSDEEAAAIASRLRDFYTGFQDQLSNRWRAEECAVSATDSIGPTRVPPWETMVGNASATPMPNDCAIVVSWRTAFRGRSYRGRTYLGGWTTSAVDAPASSAPVVLASYTSAIAVAAEGLIQDTPPDLVIHSEVPTVGDNGVLGGYVNGTWDTQRRRDKSTISQRTDFSI